MTCENVAANDVQTLKRARRWSRNSEWISQYLVGGLFIYSSFSKALNPSAVAGVLRFDGFPLASIERMTWLIVFVEAILGVSLISDYKGGIARKMTCAVLGVFILQLLYLVMFKEPPTCGCPGLLKEYFSNRQSAVLGIFRNIVLISVLVVAGRNQRFVDQASTSSSPGQDGR